MTGFRSTGVMTLLVAALAGYTFYEYKNAAEDAETEKGERRIFQLLRDDLEEIELDVKGVKTIIRRDGAGWKVAHPVEDVAEQSAVEGFLYTLLTQKGKVFQEEKNPKWADFGLDPVTTSVSVKGKGKTEALQVGKNAFDGRFYIRVGGELWMGDIGLAQLLEREPNGFRTRRIYRGPDEVREVEIQLDHQGLRDTYTLKRGDNKEVTEWKMTPDPGFPLDGLKTQAWVQKLTGFTGTDFATEMPKGKSSLQAKFGEWVVQFSQDTADGVYITSNKNPFVYKSAVSALNPVRVARGYFRDGKVPFKFNLELVREIEVRSSKVKEVFVKKDETWALKRKADDVELDQEKLVQMVHHIQNLEAADFAPIKAPPPGLSNAVVMRGEGGKEVFFLHWGGEYKSKLSWAPDLVLRYAQASGTAEILGLAKDKLDRLIDSAIIKKKAAPK